MTTEKKRMLYVDEVTAPDSLNLSGAMQDPTKIEYWWERVKLYANAMASLDRATLLRYDEDENTWYLSSVEVAQ